MGLEDNISVLSETIYNQKLEIKKLKYRIDRLEKRENRLLRGLIKLTNIIIAQTNEVKNQ